MKRRLLPGVVLLLLSLGILATVAPGRANDQLPASVTDDLGKLKSSFLGLLVAPDLGTSGMARQLDKNKDAIGSLLTYAESSSSNADALSAYLLGELDAFAQRFKPGAAIDDRLLARREWVREEWPWYGLSVDAYLLLEIAGRKGSPAFTKRVLGAIYGAEQGVAYFFQRRAIQNHAQVGEEAPAGPVVSVHGAEFAWFCERMMVQAYLADTFANLPSAQAVVKAYWDWRKQTMIARGRAPGCR
jgi:hypothetical protein